MRADLLCRALRAALEVLESAPDDTVSSEPYDRDRLPPGAASWRAVLEAGRRGELEVTRIGRRAVVTREAWETYVARRRRRGPVAVQDADRDTLARMGVVLPMRAAGGGR